MRCRLAFSSIDCADLAADQSTVGLAEPETWRWIDGSGYPLPDFHGVLSAIHETYASREDVEVHVGCDSAVQSGGRVVFATVVCVISRGKAGRYFYARLIEPKRHYPVLQTRLLREVELSLSTAEVHAVSSEPCATQSKPAAQPRSQT